MILIKILKGKQFGLPKTNKIAAKTVVKTKGALNYAKANGKIKYLAKTQELKKSEYVTQNLINYVMNIQISATNTLVSLTDSKGDPVISFSGGSINLKKRQKRLQPLALVNILKFLLLKARFLHNKTIAVHFKNVKTYYESMVIKMLKRVLFIKSIKSYNLQPHNGCRPKKMKRFKQRTKRS